MDASSAPCAVAPSRLPACLPAKTNAAIGGCVSGACAIASARWGTGGAPGRCATLNGGALGVTSAVAEGIR